MKKAAVLTAMLVICAASIYAQEPEPPDGGNGPEFSVIARLESNPFYNSESSSWDHSFGVSSLYALLDGSFSDHFSYSVATHLLAGSGEQIKSLYDYTFYSCACNWLDWANLSFNTTPADWGGLTFTLGKDIMAVGTFEIDDYDFDAHPMLCSYFWNMTNVYLWGGSVSYTTPSEKTTFKLQASSSPYTLKIFQDGLMAYSLKWSGEYGPYSSLWSANMLQTDKSEFQYILAMGNALQLGNFLGRLDCTYRPMKFGDRECEAGIAGHLQYTIDDKVDIILKGGYDYVYGLKTGFAGPVINWYPLKDSQDLRIHLAGSWNQFNYDEEVLSDIYTICIGATYNFNISRLLSRKK